VAFLRPSRPMPPEGGELPAEAAAPGGAAP
jgi:hypothetical protein